MQIWSKIFTSKVRICSDRWNKFIILRSHCHQAHRLHHTMRKCTSRIFRTQGEFWRQGLNLREWKFREDLHSQRMVPALLMSKNNKILPKEQVVPPSINYQRFMEQGLKWFCSVTQWINRRQCSHSLQVQLISTRCHKSTRWEHAATKMTSQFSSRARMRLVWRIS